ncbi:hypothetical protein O3M35_002718 [Rhynocoris fuscipes]|uniref:Uncharacterized protein n=1 Tax=Rhynocoris fuscipes TaxID=488301 RepID=A0AAW1CQA6_9HEMI
MGLVEEFRRRCGGRVTAEHIVDCPLYGNRVVLQRRIGFHLGLDGWTLPLLLENKVPYEAFVSLQ